MEGEARGRRLRPPPRPQPASRDSSPRRAGCPLGELGQAPSVPHPTCAKQPAGWGRLPLRLGGCVWVNEGTGGTAAFAAKHPSTFFWKFFRNPHYLETGNICFL